MAPPDFDVRAFARILTRLNPTPPITTTWDRAHPQRAGAWWPNQREHMVNWFQAQPTRGTGAYTRRDPNTSARTTYQRLLAPGGLLWIAEALGAPPDLVETAASAAALEPDKRRRPGIIRTHLPWPLIAELATQHQQRRPRWRHRT